MAQKLYAKNDRETINHFIQNVAAFQFASVIDHNWLLRGGITIGDLYIDDVMVWGTALLQSHDLESGAAFFPRVVIDSSPDVLNRLHDSGIHQGSWLQYNLSAGLARSFDCMVHAAQGRGGIINKRVFQKLGWHRRYVNRFLRTLENASCYLQFPSIEAAACETT